MNLSLVLEASDKRREGVARSLEPLLTYLPVSNGNYDLCCLSPQSLFLPRSKRLFVLVFLKKKRPSKASLNGPVKNNKQGGCVVNMDIMLQRSNANAAF